MISSGMKLWFWFIRKGKSLPGRCDVKRERSVSRKAGLMENTSTVVSPAASTADLHMHSIYSDGKDDLPALLEKVRAAGIRTFALTDHDTVDGAQQMIGLVPSDMRFIPSIEFSCKYLEEGKDAKWSCHILGHGADPSKTGFADVVRAAKQVRLDKMQWRYDALQAIYHITFTPQQKAWIDSHSSPGKPHLAQVLTGMLYEEKEWQLPDEKSSDEAWKQYRGHFQNLIKEKLNSLSRKSADAGIAPCSAHMEPREAIGGILLGDGLPVWAHPFGENIGKFISRDKVRLRLEKLISFGLQGIECWYSQYNEEEIGFLLSLAEEYGLLVSGGSDYHSFSVKPNRLGELNTYGRPVDEGMLSILQALV